MALPVTTGASDFELATIFMAVVCLVAAAQALGLLFQRFDMPRVIGEIAGGLALGPSVLGHVAPDLYRSLFAGFPTEGKLIWLLYWIGLVLLMFVSGFEVQRSVDRGDGRLITAILIGATVVSFAAGVAAPALHDFSPFAGPKANAVSLTLIIAIAIAVTSIPVMSRIFLDLGMMRTRFAKIVLFVATVEDILLWMALAVALGAAGASRVSVQSMSVHAGMTIVFFAAVLLILPPLVRRLNRVLNRSRDDSSTVATALTLCFALAGVASMLGLNVVFGALLAGIILGTVSGEHMAKAKEHIAAIGMGFFIPLYFAIVGWKIDLVHHFDLPFFCGFLAVAVLCKAGGTLLAARAAGQDWLSSANLAVAMNARGGPGIVVATVAFEAQIIDETFFSILVVTALITSLMAGWWLRWVQKRGWPLLAEASPRLILRPRPRLVGG